MEKWAFVRLVVAVRAVAFQPVRKVIRQQRAVCVILRWGDQKVGERVSMGFVPVRLWWLVGCMFVVLADDGLELSSMVSFADGNGVPSPAMLLWSDGCFDGSCFMTADKSSSEVISECGIGKSRFIAIESWYIYVENALLRIHQAMQLALSPKLASSTGNVLYEAHSMYPWMHQTHDTELQARFDITNPPPHKSLSAPNQHEATPLKKRKHEFFLYLSLLNSK
jgi:hypothetical protein